MSPSYVSNTRVHHEIGHYANKPQFKRLIRHAGVMLESVETLMATILHKASRVSPQTIRTVTLGIQSVREELMEIQGRYFLGGTAINANLHQVAKEIRHGIHVLSAITHKLFSDVFDVDLMLDDSEIDLRGSVFDHSMEMDSTKEQILLVVFNPHSHTMNTVIRIPVGFPTICAFSESNHTITQQIYTDIEQANWILISVILPPLSSRLIVLRHCRNNAEYRMRASELKEDKKMIIEPTHGIVLDSQGEVESFIHGNETVPLKSYVGHYRGTDVRACRTGQ